MVICLKNSYAFQNFGKHYCKVFFQFSIGLPSGLLSILQKSSSISEVHSKLNINIFFLSSVFHSWQSPGWHICPLEDSLRLILTFEHSFIASCSSYQIHDPIFLRKFSFILTICWYNMHILWGIKFTPRNMPSRNAYVCSPRDVF